MCFLRVNIDRPEELAVGLALALANTIRSFRYKMNHSTAVSDCDGLNDGLKEIIPKAILL